MKHTATLLSALFILAAASTASAGNQQSAAATLCKQEIQMLLGEETRVDYRQFRNRGQQGIEVRIVAITPAAGRQRINCIYRAGEVQLSNKEGQPLTIAASGS
jgi:hypothetical protein